MRALTFPDDWRTIDGIFGGYVVGRMLEVAEVAGYDPLSISVQFQSGVRPGPCEVRTAVVHQGSLTAVVELELVQEHRRAAAVAKLGRGSRRRLIEQRVGVGDLPPQGGVPDPLPYGPFPYDGHLEFRLIPEGFAHRSERLLGWVRLTEPAGAGLSLPAAACVLLDTMPPGPFFTDPAPSFVPTVDLTAHFAPAVQWHAADWMFLTRNTRWATREFCVEEASLHTADGRLVAEARQARRLIWPPV